MKKTLTGIAAAAAAAIALSACGASAASSPAPAAPASPAPAAASTAPANPVPILRQAGFTPKAGETHGIDWIGGLEAETADNAPVQVAVYTTGDQATFDQEQTTNTPSDNTGVVTIPSKLATILIQTGDASNAQEIAAQVAQRVHGLLIAPQS
jgi:hypothetical protein